jgi:hypothetical protein
MRRQLLIIPHVVYNPHPFPRGHNREYLGQKDNASGLDKLRHQTISKEN